MLWKRQITKATGDDNNTWNDTWCHQLDHAIADSRLKTSKMSLNVLSLLCVCVGPLIRYSQNHLLRPACSLAPSKLLQPLTQRGPFHFFFEILKSVINTLARTKKGTLHKIPLQFDWGYSWSTTTERWHKSVSINLQIFANSTPELCTFGIPSDRLLTVATDFHNTGFSEGPLLFQTLLHHINDLLLFSILLFGISRPQIIQLHLLPCVIECLKYAGVLFFYETFYQNSSALYG